MVRTRSGKGGDWTTTVGQLPPPLSLETTTTSSHPNTEVSCPPMVTLNSVELEDSETNDTSSSSDGDTKDDCDYQKILGDRKAERRHLAEQERLDGLGVIGEMNSKTGIHPVEQFPKEIWVEILSYLTPQDKATVWKIHPLFRDLMERRRVRDILFPQLLDHKIGFIEKYFDDPHSNSDVLKLRLVSQTLCKAIEKWFEEDSPKFWEPPLKDSWRILKNLRWGAMNNVAFNVGMSREDDNLDNRNLEEIRKIKKPMKIFEKELCIRVGGAPARATRLDRNERRRYFHLFIKNVTEALEQVGDQIWRFEFYTEEIHKYGVTRSELSSFVRELLGHLPNLKFLDICFISEWEWDENERELIDDSLLNQEFPLLQYLERFDFGAVSDNILDRICDAVIAGNRQIKIFNYLGEYMNINDRMRHPSVQSLELELCCMRHSGVARKEFDDIERIIVNSSWILKTIDLHVVALNSTISSFIGLWNRLPTLEYVSLNIDRVNFDEGNNNIDFLRLPNLVHFGLKFKEIQRRMYTGNIHFFLSLQFLLHSSKLKSLKWINASQKSMSTLSRHIKLYDQQHPHEMLDFGGGFQDLGKSKLWDAFPRLEYVHVECKSMDRKDIYRKYRGLSSTT